MNKRYLISDDYDNGNTKLMDYEELLEFLCNELHRDTVDCYENENLAGVESNLKVLKSFAQKHYQSNEVIKQLANFGWYVMDLTKLQDYLSNYQVFKHGAGAPIYPNDCINQTLNMIEEDMKCQ